MCLMKPKKSVFAYFVNILFLVAVLYALICGVSDLGVGREYPYLIRGGFFILLLVCWGACNALAAFAARVEIEDLVRKHRRTFNVAEAVFVLVVLVAAAWLRIEALRSFPMQPASDFKTYYEIAELLKNGTIQKKGVGYCDYIAQFPHVYGYPRFLATLFRFFGTKVSVAQGANVALAVGTVFLVYRTGRLAGGRLAGLAALVISAFWPSQILYVTMVASEFLFSFLLMLGVYLFVLSIKVCTPKMRRPGLGVLLHVAIGLVLGACSTVRPMALIVLITIFLCIFPQKLFLNAEQSQNPSVSLMIISKGWTRCLIVLACYALFTTATNLTIEQTIDRKLAGGTTSFGYNLLVGLNTESEGGWNAEDANYLNDTYNRTGDAEQAHLACRDLAITRLKTNPEGLFNLFLRKYHILWANDDYGGTWNLTLLDEQGNLTSERETFLYSSRDWGNLYYLVCIALAGICGIFLWRKGNDIEYVFILIFVGTVGMHMFVEIQNRYHYHALFMFALLAGCTVQNIYRMNRAKVLKLREDREAVQELLRQKQERIEKMRRDEAELTRLRENAMKSKFDMKDALERNLIRVSVSEAFRETPAQEGSPDES